MMIIARRVLLALLSAAVVLTVAQSFHHSRVAQPLKLDLAEIDDIRYGLLSASGWIDHLVVVLDAQVEGFKETPAQREQVEVAIEAAIREVITEVERTIRADNESRTFGSLRQLATDFVVDFDALRDSSGEYAAAAVDRLDEPENRERVKAFLREQIDAFADSTFVEADRTSYEATLARHGCVDRAACRSLLESDIEASVDSLERAAWLSIALVAVMFVLAWPRPGRFGAVELGTLLLAVFALLAGGLLTPMIDIKAEIASLELILVGNPIAFDNQVLFFQSKSIIDVIDLLVRTARADLVLVGIGIGAFSVLFPICKLLATVAYRVRPASRDRRVVKFFALESAKWSMADVFVVALFLAFLGFDGLTGNQLAALVSDSPNLGVETQNGTQLGAGFHLFAAFCVGGLVLSALLRRVSPAAGPEGLHEGVSGANEEGET